LWDDIIYRLLFSGLESSMAGAIDDVRSALMMVAYKDNFVVVDEYEAAHMWHIAPIEQVEVFAELVLDRGVLVLSCRAGEVPEPKLKSAALVILRYAYT